ncbi:MAG: class B sortase [Bacilli bacterium]|nr:class B sortase [Bacilli bacterium]
MIYIKKIVVTTDDSSIIFSYKIEDPEFIDISDYTNIIDNSNLVFNEKYMRNNKDIISYFLKGIIAEKHLHSIVINDYELIDLTLDIIENIKDLTNIYITPNEKLNFDLCDKLSNNNNLTYINCYDMPEFMFEKINQNNNIKIDLRCEIFSVSNFISNNKLTTFSSIYYKDTICFEKLMNDDDIGDFETFCKINRKLKNIIIKYYFIGDIKKIVEILKENNVRNIKISIYTDNKNFSNVEESIPYLKVLNKKLKKSNNISIRIKYSNEYKNEKYVKQWNISYLKVCGCILIALALGLLGYQLYYNYSASKTVNELQELANNNIQDEPKQEVNEEPIVNEDIEEEVNTEEVEKSDPLTEDYDKLKSINPDTVGWLKVNNTSINYPVVQADNNQYYLNHTFYKKTNGIGWIYMDYRNNIDELSSNTIIYGHNLRKGTLMFTTLHNLLKEKWLNNSNNHIITFNTPNEQMKWQIFSIYISEPTSDYLYTRFSTKKIHQDFLDQRKSMSVYDFGINVTSDDKILTLSTCAEKGTKRLVVHAKLIK